MKLYKPSDTEEWEIAYHKLVDVGFSSTELFQSWKEGSATMKEWIALGIKPGIGMQLAQAISKWKIEKRRDQYLNTGGRADILPMRPSPQRRDSALMSGAIQSIEHDDASEAGSDNSIHTDPDAFKYLEVYEDDAYNSPDTQDPYPEYTQDTQKSI